jgi:hypothetical protein
MFLAAIIILVVWTIPFNPGFDFVPTVVTILAIIYGVLKLTKFIDNIINEYNGYNE